MGLLVPANLDQVRVQSHVKEPRAPPLLLTGLPAHAESFVANSTSLLSPQRNTAERAERVSFGDGARH
jgi:hypothetical protein